MNELTQKQEEIIELQKEEIMHLEAIVSNKDAEIKALEKYLHQLAELVWWLS